MHRQCSGGWMNNARGCGRNCPTCSRRWCVERCFSQLFMSSLDLMKYCSCIWTGLLWAQHCWKCINVSHSHPWALQDYWGQDACESAGLGLSKVSKLFKKDDSQYSFNSLSPLLLFSRSGSSLVGDLVSSIPNASYFFEPLHSFPARARWHNFRFIFNHTHINLLQTTEWRGPSRDHFWDQNSLETSIETKMSHSIAGNIGQISWPQIRKCLQGSL